MAGSFWSGFGFGGCGWRCFLRKREGRGIYRFVCCGSSNSDSNKNQTPITSSNGR